MVAALTSCERQGLCDKPINNPNFHVTLLFECEGVKVYRFYDLGRAHYFTSRGETVSHRHAQVGKTQVHWEENI